MTTHRKTDSTRGSASPTFQANQRRGISAIGKACVLASLAVFLFAGLLTGCQASPEHSAYGLIIVSYDTVRRDHLSTYGYPKRTSPNLDRLAQSGVRFDNAFTAETNTNPSHATMFTGLYPHEHGSQANGHLLEEKFLTLAEVLQNRGYRTAGFVTGVPMSASASRLDQGFEFYDDAFEETRRHGEEATDRALEWLNSDGSRPPFLFLHLYDAHGPYQPTVEEQKAFSPSPLGKPLTKIPPYQQLHNQQGQPVNHLGPYLDRYDALLLRLDGLLGKLLHSVDLENTFVLVVADHGETQDERFFQLDHGAQLFDEQIRIPMVLAGPGLEPQRFTDPVETVDIFPTLLALSTGTTFGTTTGTTTGPATGPAGHPPDVSGIDLSKFLTRPNFLQSPREFVFSAARADPQRFADRGYDLPLVHRIFSVRSNRHKLIVYPGSQQTYFEFYDLHNDPGETINVMNSNRSEARRFLAALKIWNPEFDQPIGMVDISEKLREQLRSLGYL